MPAPQHLVFYMPDAFPAIQPTVSGCQTHLLVSVEIFIDSIWCNIFHTIHSKKTNAVNY